MWPCIRSVAIEPSDKLIGMERAAGAAQSVDALTGEAPWTPVQEAINAHPGQPGEGGTPHAANPALG